MLMFNDDTGVQKDHAISVDNLGWVAPHPDYPYPIWGAWLVNGTHAAFNSQEEAENWVRSPGMIAKAIDVLCGMVP